MLPGALRSGAVFRAVAVEEPTPTPEAVRTVVTLQTLAAMPQFEGRSAEELR